MKNLVLTLTILFIFSGVTFGQGDKATDSHILGIDITAHSMLKISSSKGSTTIKLDPNDPSEAGAGIDFQNVENTDLWLNYSVIKNESGQKFSIKASMERGTLPDGISIKVAAAKAEGNAKGDIGDGSGIQTLPDNGDEILVVTNIGSCHTGSGANNGSNLTYTADFDDSNASYAALTQGNYSATITYTIEADN